MSASDDTIFEQMIRVENKDIFVDLKKNKGGVYLKISERNGSGRNTVLIPASGIPRLKAVLDEVAKESVKSKSVSRERKNRVAGDPEIASRSVYVTGLTWDTNEEELAQHFAQVGEVASAVILRQRRGGNNRSSMGCGVVEYASTELAVEATQALNESELKGRKIRVREDRIPADGGGEEDGVEPAATGVVGTTRAPRVKKTRPTDEERVPEPNKVFVSSLSWDTTIDDLVQLFSSIGHVVGAEVLSTKKGRAMGAGIVEFGDSSYINPAIEQLTNHNLKGRAISVRQYYQ